MASFSAKWRPGLRTNATVALRQLWSSVPGDGDAANLRPTGSRANSP